MNEPLPPQDIPVESSPSGPVWASYGLGGEYEDFIVGSPDGLRMLRDHIDAAIQKGESIIQDTRIEFTGVRCSQSSSDIPPHTKPWQDTLARYGCYILALTILALAAYGAYALVR